MAKKRSSNVQVGDNTSTTRQSGSASSGDAIVGQKVMVDSGSGSSSVRQTNVTTGSTARTGVTTGGNPASSGVPTAEPKAPVAFEPAPSAAPAAVDPYAGLQTMSQDEFSAYLSTLPASTKTRSDAGSLPSGTPAAPAAVANPTPFTPEPVAPAATQPSPPAASPDPFPSSVPATPEPAAPAPAAVWTSGTDEAGMFVTDPSGHRTDVAVAADWAGVRKRKRSRKLF